MLTSLEVIRQRAKDARNDEYYDLLYSLKEFMAGNVDLAKPASKGSKTWGSDEDLPDYPDIVPAFGIDSNQGMQNHTLISSRINIQATGALLIPDIQVEHPEPLVRDIIEAYLRDRWQRGDWSAKNYEIGMDVEAVGVGFSEWGINAAGLTDKRRVDCHDILWDPTHRSPGDWEYYFIRDRMTLDDAATVYAEAFGDNAKEELKKYSHQRGKPVASVGSGGIDLVTVWRYWDATTHCTFIGGIQKGVVLVWNPATGGSVKSEESGANPFGIIPVSTWVDSWSPGVARPVGKTETTHRTANMLALVERYITKIIKNMPPVNVISTVGLADDKLIEKIKNAGNLDEIGDLIVTDHPNIHEVMQRIPGGDAAMTLFRERDTLKQELNAATGVSDSSRGQLQPGERTAKEITYFNESQGVQARHTRNQYARMLRQDIEIAKWIGGKFDRGTEPLSLDDGKEVHLDRYPLRIWLTTPALLMVNENSLEFKTHEDKVQKRIQQFITVDTPAMQMGVADPVKVFTDLYKSLGVRDVSKILFGREMPIMPMMPGNPALQGAQGVAGGTSPHLQELTANAG